MVAKNANAHKRRMICTCCFMSVRYSKTADAWFHVNGNPETETIAREIMPDNGIIKPMRPVMPDQPTLDMMPYPTKENKPTRQINNIRIVNGRV